jgi:hypothetical protein
MSTKLQNAGDQRNLVKLWKRLANGTIIFRTKVKRLTHVCLPNKGVYQGSKPQDVSRKQVLRPIPWVVEV